MGKFSARRSRARRVGSGLGCFDGIIHPLCIMVAGTAGHSCMHDGFLRLSFIVGILLFHAAKGTASSPGIQSIRRRFIDRLYASDVGRFVGLPQIAVIGDTPSEKLSLISAISKVPFPTNDEITIHCLTRVHMEHREKGTEITVDIKWHSTSSYKDEKWRMLRVENLSGIQEAIEEAQECILAAAGQEVVPDIIEINVQSPDALDLTLIDLPSMVGNVIEGESESLVSDTASLVTEYLKNERCIILAVVPASSDFRNNRMMAEAMKADPKTCRTLPVLMKPNLIDAGDDVGAVESRFLRMKEDFKLGAHMIKCSGQKALNKRGGLRDGIHRERKYFKTTSPWKEMEDRSSLGVESLREKLVALQVSMIEESVPAIMTEVGEKKALVSEELERLGQDLSTDGLRRECCTRFVDGAARFVTDTAAGRGSFRTKDSFTWRSKLENLYSAFATDVMEQRLADMGSPKEGSAVYVVDTMGHEVKGIICQIGDKERSDVVYVDPVNDTQPASVFFERGEARDYLRGETKVGQKYIYNMRENPLIIRSVINETCQDIKKERFMIQDYKPFPLGRVYPCHGWLQDRLATSRTEDLACFLSPTVFRSIVADLLRSDVEPLCLGLLDACHALLSALADAVPSADSDGRCAKLHALLRERARAVIADLHGCAQRRLRERLDVEQLPFASSRHLHDTISKKRSARLESRLLAATAGKTDPAATAAAVSAVLRAEERRSCEEHAAMEMQMAVEAYGTLASERLIDDVPMLITAALVAPLADGLRASLRPTDAELRALLEEAPGQAERRRRAEERLLAMEAAEAAFDALSGARPGLPCEAPGPSRRHGVGLGACSPRKRRALDGSAKARSRAGPDGG